MFVGMKRSSQGGLRLGEILVEAGVVRSDIVNQSLAIAKTTKMPLGRVLIDHAQLSDLLIRNAIEMQTAVREGRFTKEHATKLIRTAHCNNITVEQADAQLAWERAFKTSFSELGKLFLAAGVIPEESLWNAQLESKSEGAPIGAYLAEKESIAPELMSDALKIMVLCREQRLSNTEAIMLLQKIASEKLSFEDAAVALGLTRILEERRLRLAELMVEANVLNEATALEAVELSIEKKRFLGEILVEEGFINPNLLEAALNLQEMVNVGILVRSHAAELLGIVQQLNTPLDDVLYELERINKMARFMLNAGLVSEKDQNRLFSSDKCLDINIGKEVLNSGLVPDKYIGYASYFQKIIEAQVVTQEEAIGVLHYCIRYRIEPAQAMVKLGFHQSPQWASADKELQLSA
jgi:hypothetical protein